MAINGIQTSHMRFFGLASGMDVDEIVQGLMKAERAPLDRLLQRKQILQWQQEDFRSINRLLRELRDLTFSLRLEQTFQARTVTSSHESILQASASAGAPTGTHTLRVHQLAEGVRFHSREEITVDGGKVGGTLAEQFGLDSDAKIQFTIYNFGANGGAGAYKTFTFTAGKDTLQDVIKEINASDLELQASYEADLDRFFLSSRNTGASVQISFSSTSDIDFLRDVLKLNYGDDCIEVGQADPEDVMSGQNGAAAGLKKIYEGKNAIFDYDGVKNIKRSTNEFTIGGVRYQLLKADPDTEVTVHVRQDVDAAVNAIKAFVEKYNEVVERVGNKLVEKRYYDYPPLLEAQKEEMTEKEIELWEERARSGLLRGDSLLSSILAQLRRVLGTPVQNTGSPYSTLSSIGITTGAWDERGILHINESKLREAIAADPEGVAALFRQDGQDEGVQGLARRLAAALDHAMERIGLRVGYADSAVDNSAIGRQLSWLNDEIERAQERLLQRENYYYRQFTILETFISQMNTQSLWLAQTFGGAF